MFIGTGASGAGIGILLSFSDNGDLATSISLLVGGTLLFILGLVLRTKNEKRHSELQNNLLELENSIEQMSTSIRQHCIDVLRVIGETKLGFTSGTGGHCRISFYLHDPLANIFTLNARYSHDPVFLKPGRSTFPDDQGVISKCWRSPHGEIYRSVPIRFEADKAAYSREQRKLGLSVDDARKLRMKSQLYFGWRVRDKSVSHQVGVFIVESTHPTRWSAEQLRCLFEDEAENLRSVAELLMPWARQPVLASGEQY